MDDTSNHPEKEQAHQRASSESSAARKPWSTPRVIESMIVAQETQKSYGLECTSILEHNAPGCS